MRGTTKVTQFPLIFFDTGADANFTFRPLWRKRKFLYIGDIRIDLLSRRSCAPITVKAAFGSPCIIFEQIELCILFPQGCQIKSWFYVLPNDKPHLFLGKPLLRQLHYQLNQDSECIYIDNVRVELSDIPFVSNSTTLFATSKKSLLEELRVSFPSTFSSTFSTELFHDYKAHVTLRDFPFTTPTAYFSSGYQRNAIQQYVEQSLQNGLLVPIKPDELVALSPVFPLKQSADKIRIITDLRKVNKYLQYTPRPIPTTQSILSDLSSKSIFSAIDIRKAYQQLPLTGDKLGIITEFGSYRFTRVPYGLASAPYWWGEFIQSIIAQVTSFTTTTIRYYYDDIIVASSDSSEHRSVLFQLFKLFQSHGLSISEEKLQLAQSHVLFLGYDISHNRISLEPDKIQTIANWKLPTSKEGILKFIGFVNYLRNFIPNTSELLAPFYSVLDTKKYAKLPATNFLIKSLSPAFDSIKHWINKTIHLKLFDPQAPTYIFTDASLTGAASVLFQCEIRDGKPVGIPLAFYSLKFTPTQQRYSTVERELFAVLHTLEHARLMLSPSITVFTDNQGIISIGNTDRYTHPRFAKFLDLLNVYRLTWRYLPGHKNVLADYLSRFCLDSQPTLDLHKWDALATDVPIENLNLSATTFRTKTKDSQVPPSCHTMTPTEFYADQNNPSPSLPPTSSSSIPDKNFTDLQQSLSEPAFYEQSENLSPNHNTNNHNTNNNEIKKGSTDIDPCSNLNWPDILLIKEYLITQPSATPSRLSPLLSYFHIVNDILYILRNRTLHRVVTDHDYMRLATKIHERYHCTHRVLTLALESQQIWNPFATLINLDVVRNCRQCDIFTKFHDLAPDLPQLKPIPVFSRWHLDFAGPLPISNGYQNFLIGADYTSNLVLVLPCVTQNSSVVIEMLHRIFATFGKPSLVITDNGAPLNNATVEQFAKVSKIQLAHSSAYYPRGNSKAERTVKMVKTVLHNLDPTYKDWYSQLTQAVNIVNNTPTIYGFSPRQLAYGLPLPPTTTETTALMKSIDTSDTQFEDITHFENVHLALIHHKSLNAIRDKTANTKNEVREALRRIRADTENVIPYMRGEYVYRFRVKRNKHEPSWDGPYRIYEQTGKNTYKLLSAENKVSKATYHSSKLKPAYNYYGSPIRTAAEYTRVYSDKERKYYIHTLEDLERFIK